MVAQLKIRKGFVSNSSSTSWTCDICGGSWAGSDGMSDGDAGFWRCANQHLVCESHKLPGREEWELTATEKYELLLKCLTWEYVQEKLQAVEDPETWEELDDYWEDYRYEVGGGTERCPICQMQEVAYDEALKYLLWKKGMKDKKELLKELLEVFGTHDKMKEKLNES
jgi:hypothetical protein